MNAGKEEPSALNHTATSPLSLDSVHRAAELMAEEERQQTSAAWWRRSESASLLLSPLLGCAAIAGVVFVLMGGAFHSDSWDLLPWIAGGVGLLLGAGYLASLALVSLFARKSSVPTRVTLACIATLPMAGLIVAAVAFLLN